MKIDWGEPPHTLGEGLGFLLAIAIWTALAYLVVAIILLPFGVVLLPGLKMGVG